MGEVYLAEDTALNRRVAIKFLPQHLCQDADCRVRFRREALAAAKLNHPNIVTIHEVGEYNGRPFMVTEYAGERTLSDVIASNHISPSDAINIIVQVCEGLDEAHNAGIVHRDIKPSNIVLEKSGHPKIVDFGLAAIQGADKLTMAGSAMGTIGYMAPEQLRGTAIDRRADLFSVGIVLYELITGKNPFAAETQVAVQTLILSGIPEPMARFKAGVPDGLQEVVDRALEKEPSIRYQSAADLAADLRRLRRRSSESNQPRRTSRLTTRRSHKRMLFALIVVLALVTLSVWWVYRTGTSTQNTIHKQVAVIPFTNLASQSTSQAFCDGLMETLSSMLTQVGGSEGKIVIVPASEIREKGIKSAAQARKVFGVTLVVTGSVQELGDNIRTTLNLVDAATERQLRSAVVDKHRDDVSSLQNASVIEVAGLLDIPVRPEFLRILQAGVTASSSANTAYLEGRGYLQRYDDAQGLDSAEQCFKGAISMDSSYALAYAGLGEVYWRMYNLTNDVSRVALAIRFSSRALELNDELAPVLVTLGIVHRITGQYQEALSYLKRALLIDSVDNETYRQLASVYESLGRVAEAESTYQRSIHLRPDYWRSYYNLARFYAFQGKKDKALNQALKAESLAPAATFPYESLGSLYTFLGMYDKAKLLLERSLSIQPNYVSLSNLGAIYQMEGQQQKAVNAYERALEINNLDYHVWSNLAWMYKTLPGGQDKARVAYNRAIALAEQSRAINPNDPSLICYLADCYWQTGEREKSLALAQQALELSPQDMEVMVRSGIIFEEAGRREQALKLIGNAVRKGYSLVQIMATDELRQLVTDPRFDSVLKENR